MKKLTVIIPFLNEGIEVRNTLKSIRESTKDNFDIILINDSSTDGYNYENVAKEYNAFYIEHNERLGVAASRDEAIYLCKTRFFLLLDAHMRALQDNWAEIIVSELNKDERSLLCCKTIALDTKGQPNKEKPQVGFGAYIKDDLSIGWILRDLTPDKAVVDIPCILGASYATSKRYWQYLKGLTGLRSYGLDEQMISIKVWLEGGKCKLLKNVEFGHIFRTSKKVPYKANIRDFDFNKLYLCELLIGFDHSIKIIKSIGKVYEKEDFNSLMNLLINEKAMILEQKEYFIQIFRHKYNFFHELNTTTKNHINQNNHLS